VAVPARPPVSPSGAVEPPRDDTLERIVTIPNVLSVARLAGVGLFCYLLFGPDLRVAAAVVLAVTGVTDFLDGYLARRLHQVSRLGKVLDPTADRVVLGTGVIAIAVYGAVPGWLAGIVLGRELVVSVGVLMLASIGAARIDVLWVGKAATLGFMVAFPLLLLGDGSGTAALVVTTVGEVVVAPALVLSLVALLAYVPAARKALADTRADRGGS
jgi:cardiolipin synthase